MHVRSLQSLPRRWIQGRQGHPSRVGASSLLVHFLKRFSPPARGQNVGAMVLLSLGLMRTTT